MQLSPGMSVRRGKADFADGRACFFWEGQSGRTTQLPRIAELSENRSINPVQWLRFFKPQRRQFWWPRPRLPTTSNGPPEIPVTL
jgi:hypothetical protein